MSAPSKEQSKQGRSHDDDVVRHRKVWRGQVDEDVARVDSSRQLRVEREEHGRAQLKASRGVRWVLAVLEELLEEGRVDARRRVGWKDEMREERRRAFVGDRRSVGDGRDDVV